MLDKPNNELKAELIIKFWNKYHKDPLFQSFFEYNNLGVPLAQLSYDSIVDITNDHAQRILDDTYYELCQVYLCNPNKVYLSLEEMAHVEIPDDEE
jgi:hypothetical protein